MKRIELESTNLTAAELAKIAKREAVILTKAGKPIVTVRHLGGHDWESVSLANDPDFLALIEESRRSYRERGGITIENVRKKLGLKARRPKSRTSRTTKAH